MIHGVTHLHRKSLLRNGTIFVVTEKAFQVLDLGLKLSNLSRQGLVLERKSFDFLLQVLNPRLLTLATFQRGNPSCNVSS